MKEKNKAQKKNWKKPKLIELSVKKTMNGGAFHTSFEDALYYNSLS